MSYALTYNLALGSGKAGLTDLRAQLYDSTGTDVGAAISTGFVALGSGNYSFTAAAIPSALRGGIKFYSYAAAQVILVASAITPITTPGSSVPAITLASLRAACRRSLASATDWPDDTLDAWLIEAIRTYSIQMPRRWQHTITLTTGTQAYAVPGNHGFHRILSIEYVPTADDATPYFLTEVAQNHPAFIRKNPVYALTGIVDSTNISADAAAINITFAQAVTTADDAIVTYLGDWPTPTIASDYDVITIPASHTEALLAFVLFRAHWELVTDRSATPTPSASVLATCADTARRAWSRYKELMNIIDASTTPAANWPTEEI